LFHDIRNSRLSQCQWNETHSNYRQLIAELAAILPIPIGSTPELVATPEFVATPELAATPEFAAAPEFIAAPEALRLSLQGLHHQIIKRILKLDRIAQQKRFVDQHAHELLRVKNMLIPINSYCATMAANSNVLLCVICNVLCHPREPSQTQPGRPVRSTLWICPGQCSHAAHVKMRCSLQYAQTIDYSPLGEILCKYANVMAERPDAVNVLAQMGEKQEKIMKDIWTDICSAARCANQLDPSQKFWSECSFLRLLIEVEQSSGQYGHDVRHDALCQLAERFVPHEPDKAISEAPRLRFGTRRG
jgi:hypothetical protein